jgi:hypothetical protein
LDNQQSLPMTVRAPILVAMAIFSCPGYAEQCVFGDSTVRSINDRTYEMTLPGDSTIVAIKEDSLNEAARAGATRLFTERSSSPDDLADRVALFLLSNQDAANIAQNNLNFLRNRLHGRSPPGFLAVDMSYKRLGYLQKLASILSLQRYAQVNELGVRSAQWDKLLLITVGPVVYLRTREPELFHATALMAMDDQALSPFHDALNWQEQKIPGWMEELAGKGGVKEMGAMNVGGPGKLPVGDGIFVLSNGSLPAISSAFVSACEKLRSPPTSTPTPGKIEQGDNVPTAREDTVAAEEQSRSTSRSHVSTRQADFHRAAMEVDPEVARRNAMARHALAYSWVTTDGSGRRWVHIRPIHYSQKE